MVDISFEISSVFVASTSTQSSPELTIAPISINFELIIFIVSGLILLIFTCPLVIAPATMYVPASIRSNNTSHLSDFKDFIPLISIKDSPAPTIFAPQLFKKFANSTTSGSLAQFLNIVLPSMMAAAIIKFSVPVTDIFGKLKSIGFNLSASR